MRQSMEAAAVSRGCLRSDSVFIGIECPTNQDVLLGRGRPLALHRGNMAMREAVQCRLERFSNALDKEERAAIICEVVQETHVRGGRFIKEDPGKNGWWVEVDKEAAVIKVGTYFRDLKFNAKEGRKIAAVAKAAVPHHTEPTAPAGPAPRTVGRRASGSSSVGPSSTGRRKGQSSGIWPESKMLDAGQLEDIADRGRRTPLVRDGIQEFDSSTYEFMRGQKRYKPSDGGGQVSCGGCFFF
jgi:hypothetical protein